jgi:hypothetical protein
MCTFRPIEFQRYLGGSPFANRDWGRMVPHGDTDPLLLLLLDELFVANE